MPSVTRCDCGSRLAVTEESSLAVCRDCGARYMVSVTRIPDVADGGYLDQLPSD